MYNIVVHLTECKPTSTVASAKVARFITETLCESRFNLVDSIGDALVTIETGAPIDHLIIVNGPMAFCDFLQELGEMVRRAKRVIWVQQDYTIMPPAPNSGAESPFRKAFADRHLRPDFWTTVKKNVQTANDHYINWNQLTYDPQPPRPISRLPVLMYYGAYREKREHDFKFYFSGADYQVQISTTPIRGKKFQKLGDNITIVPPFVGIGNMPVCSASLYIEDDKSHREFHSPANRFYELLSAGIPILFDIRTLKMLGEAGISPHPDWVVKSQDDVKAFINKPVEELALMRDAQRDRWDANYVGNLKRRLLEVWQDHYSKS